VMDRRTCLAVRRFPLKIQKHPSQVYELAGLDTLATLRPPEISQWRKRPWPGIGPF
jgi:hypothetical protein